jgi:hypothetical protein
MLQGQALIDLHQKGKALELFKQAVSARPEDYRGHFSLGNALVQQSDPLISDAVSSFVTSLRLLQSLRLHDVDQSLESDEARVKFALAELMLQQTMPEDAGWVLRCKY